MTRTKEILLKELLQELYKTTDSEEKAWLMKHIRRLRRELKDQRVNLR